MFFFVLGISQCSNRYAKANNKYMDTYDPAEDPHYIMYWDVNNLYGFAMEKPLPYQGFKWVNENIDVMQLEEN